MEYAIRNGHRDFEQISAIIRRTNAIDRCKKRAKVELENGKNALNAISPCIFKNSLIQLLSFVVEREV